MALNNPNILGVTLDSLYTPHMPTFVAKVRSRNKILKSLTSRKKHCWQLTRQSVGPSSTMQYGYSCLDASWRRWRSSTLVRTLHSFGTPMQRGLYVLLSSWFHIILHIVKFLFLFSLHFLITIAVCNRINFISMLLPLSKILVNK